MLCHLILWLLSFSLMRFAEGSLQVVLNQSWSVVLHHQEGNTTTVYGASLQQNTLLTGMNFTLNGEFFEPPSFGIIPNVLIEINNTIPLLNSTSVRGFLDFTSWSGDWGEGLVLKQATPSVYKISGSWYSRTATHLNFRVTMLIASKPTVYEGFSLQPQQLFMIYTIVNFPFRLLNSRLSLDQIILTGEKATNYTLPNYFVFTSNKLTSLYVNKTAIVDGIRRTVSLSKIRISSLWSKLRYSSTTRTRNLSGRNVDDFVLIFDHSNNAKNITIQQVLKSNIAMFAKQSVHEPSSHAPHAQDLSCISWALSACYLILLWQVVLY